MRLLNYYQLWMHDVFPKARFRDCIAMTEKVGHQAQLRVMRKQWIDDSKPKGIEDDIEEVEGLEVLRSLEGGEQQGRHMLYGANCRWGFRYE
jgi:replication fork protection complex subunit Csm3/Swi3